jgi:serine O-acetyltransferase
VQAGRKGTEDLVWERIRLEAAAAAREEQLLASFLYATVLNHDTLETCLAFHLANKLASTTLPSTMLNEIIRDALETAPDASYAIRLDLLAVADRDPACTRVIDALLFFKGFHALQAHRVAHWLWKQGRHALALYLHSQVCKVLQIDIHPAATIGYGVFMDHGTGIVIGETARVGNNVSMLHRVTLGGTGTKLGDRHPKIGDGVLIGAGATILGNVTVGRGAMVGACTVLTNDLPPHSTAVGVPARVVGAPRTESPAFEMDQDPTHCRKRRADLHDANGFGSKMGKDAIHLDPEPSNGQPPTP